MNNNIGSKNLLQVEEISKHFGSFVAVDSVSLSVSAGSIVGLLGPNGSGKTTLLSMLVGLFPPSSGKITLHDQQVTFVPSEMKSLFGFVPDSQEVLPYLTGREYLEFIRRIYCLSDSQWERVNDYLVILRMEQKAHDLMETYSHGQRKKIQLIAALLHNPKILLLDEPFSGLDPEMIALSKMLLRKLRDLGSALLLSTHDLSMAEDLCDNVVF